VVEVKTQAERWVNNVVRAKYEGDDGLDFYRTHPSATRALLSVEKFSGATWEPACGAGDMSSVLRSEGVNVISSDLVYRGYELGWAGVDFLTASPREIGLPRRPTNIVTNPPYNIAEAFAERAIEVATGKVALLCRLAWLESIRRQEMFERTKLSRVWVFSKRARMARGSEDWAPGMIAFAWFVWDKKHVGPTTVGFIRPIGE
jgi:hypothetical protein